MNLLERAFFYVIVPHLSETYVSLFQYTRYIQQDATLHSLLYLYLQHLVFVTPLLLPALLMVGGGTTRNM
jgi:hypothetical protein